MAKVKTTAAAKPTAPGTKVAKVTPQSNALSMPEELSEQFLADAGAGLENTSASDYALPFLYLLQDNSPQCKRSDDKYIEGAVAGMFMDTVTQELFESPLYVIPVDFEKVYNEWIPRDDGGGFVASYKDKSEAEQSKQEHTQIVDTANHYVLVQGNDEKWRPAILSCTSTKLKASRNWLSRISQVLITSPRGKVPAPSFARIYEANAVPARNQHGTFFTLGITPVEGAEGWVRDAELYEMAKDFRTQLKAGAKGADYNKTGDEIEVEAEIESDGADFTSKGRR